jgi:hypothetical protein
MPIAANRCCRSRTRCPEPFRQIVTVDELPSVDRMNTGRVVAQVLWGVIRNSLRLLMRADTGYAFA